MSVLKVHFANCAELNCKIKHLASGEAKSKDIITNLIESILIENRFESFEFEIMYQMWEL
jgi:hypothetical protein